MNTYKSVQEVPVWLKSHELTVEIYRVTLNFPKTELYGLVDQMKRSSASIPANISEGFYRKSTKELLQYLYTSRGSCGEVQYHLLLARDLRFIDKAIYEQLKAGYDDVGKQLNGWINSLKIKLT